MTIIRVDVGLGGWVVVWNMGGGRPTLVSPEGVKKSLVESKICRNAPAHQHLPDHCPSIACQVVHAWEKHLKEQEAEDAQRDR